MQKTVTARIRCGWKKFKDIASVLSKRVVSLKLRGSMYNGCVKSALWYGAECWGLKEKQRENRKLYTKMKILHMICCKTLKDSISNDKIREITFVEETKEFLREQRLQ